MQRVLDCNVLINLPQLNKAMIIYKNEEVMGSAGRAMLTDIFYIKNSITKPVVIYAHASNGFKDWGNFDVIARQFAHAGFVFVKFNF